MDHIPDMAPISHVAGILLLLPFCTSIGTCDRAHEPSSTLKTSCYNPEEQQTMQIVTLVEL